jgi:hypothetical protein
MKRLESGHILIQSAFEARLVGRAAARGLDDDTKMVTIKHDAEHDPVYRNEVIFIDREIQHGPLLTPTKHVAQMALVGASRILEEKEPFHEVTPEIAGLILRLCGQSVPETDSLPFTELTAVSSLSADLAELESLGTDYRTRPLAQKN